MSSCIPEHTGESRKGHAMILAEKIIKLRKQNGLSQEELAMRLNVSRQSVSKWESGTSVPDLNKIIRLSEIFEVSTDYLLKDEIEDEASEYTESKNEFDFDNNIEKRKVTLQEATEYMDAAKNSSAKVAFGVMLCILSPVPMILLGTIGEKLSEIPPAVGNVSYAAAEDIAGGIGIAVLFIIIACAVGIFISNGIRMSKYEYLEKELIAPEYGVASLAESRKEKFQEKYKNSMIAGTCLCILSSVPLILGGVLSEVLNVDDIIMVCLVGLLLIMVAAGVFLFVRSGIIYESFQKLLEEGDYSKDKKKAKSVYESIYWPIVIAVYLIVSFLTMHWETTWLIWPIAAVGSGILDAVFKRRSGNKK